MLTQDELQLPVSESGQSPLDGAFLVVAGRPKVARLITQKGGVSSKWIHDQED
jgi:hypothetical protein